MRKHMIGTQRETGRVQPVFVNWHAELPSRRRHSFRHGRRIDVDAVAVVSLDGVDA